MSGSIKLVKGQFRQIWEVLQGLCLVCVLLRNCYLCVLLLDLCTPALKVVYVVFCAVLLCIACKYNPF